MGQHPLIELANSREVKQASGFRRAASELTGERLAELYEQEVRNAPRRRDAGKKYFVAWNARLASSRRPNRDSEHLALALLHHVRQSGAGLPLPGEEAGELALYHALVPLKSAQVDKALGDADPNKGVDRVDLIGASSGARPTAVTVKYAAPSATRGGTGDTPLRALLEGLANCAIVQANRAALQEEVSSVAGTFNEEAPVLILLGSPRYWELCRKREAQKGAAWIKEMERLARELEEASGVSVRYLAPRLEGDPGWSYPDGEPVLDAPPRLVPAWEIGAGRVKPKPRPRPKAAEAAEVIIEADLSRPVRSYAVSESYEPGDRIQHSTLGLGVVQGPAGPGKIHVLFDEKRSLLVHERGARSAASPGLPTSA